MTESPIAAHPAEPFADAKARARPRSRPPGTRSSTCRTGSTPTRSRPSRRTRPRPGSPRSSRATDSRSSIPPAASRPRSGRIPAAGAGGPADRHPRRVRRAARASATAAATTRWPRPGSAPRSRWPRSRDDLPGEIVFLGTPAEERGSGKQIMIDDGLFEGIDAALLYHPCDRNHVEMRPARVGGRRRRLHGPPVARRVGPVEGQERPRRDDRAVRLGRPVAPAAADRTAASTGSSTRAAPPPTSSRTGPGPGS